jgi:stress response protein YsnF
MGALCNSTAKEFTVTNPDTIAESGILKVPVFEEEVRIGTRTVDTGRGIRIDKMVTEQPFDIDQLLLHEEISVNHVPVDKVVALEDAPKARYEGDTYIVPVMEEVLVVEKRMRIKEEIHISKTYREERHRETVGLKSETVSVRRFDETLDSPGT